MTKPKTERQDAQASQSGASQQTPWEGDAFNRKDYADFLTRHLVEQTHPQQGAVRPYCLALDAQWGAGKSFFVRNWRLQLTQDQKHPSFLFDAWSADYQADPFIAFMAAFKEAVELAIRELPVSKAIKTRAKKKLGNGVAVMRRALLPASKAVLKGALEKVAPGAWDEIKDVWKDQDKELDDVDFESLGGEAVKGVRAGLTRYFEESLKEQANKQKLIEEFRQEMQETLELLEKEGGAELPFFIFVDEIDRCRPSFAIALLEQLKHIFNIPGTCFVVSTNMEQLTHAIRGVYGAEFNGRTYLQRFFDSECSLPELSPREFIESQVSMYPSFKDSRISLGLPNGGFIEPKIDNPTTADTFTWVIEAFNLDLRSQKRLVAMANASLGSLKNDSKIFLIWLALLCAAKIQSEDLFEALSYPGLGGPEFKQVWDKHVVNDVPRTYFGPARQRDSFSRHEKTDVTLQQVAKWHYQAASETLRVFNNSLSNMDGNMYDYQYRLSAEIANASDNPAVSRTKKNGVSRTAIFGYSHLVTYAGHFIG
jgi:hypothetical protein